VECQGQFAGDGGLCSTIPVQMAQFSEKIPNPSTKGKVPWASLEESKTTGPRHQETVKHMGWKDNEVTRRNWIIVVSRARPSRLWGITTQLH